MVFTRCIARAYVCLNYNNYTRCLIGDNVTLQRIVGKERAMQKQAEKVATILRGLCFPMAGSSIVTNPTQSTLAATTMPAQEHFAPYCCFRQSL